MATPSIASRDREITARVPSPKALSPKAETDSTKTTGSPQDFIMWVKANAPSALETPPLVGRQFDAEEDEVISPFCLNSRVSPRKITTKGTTRSINRFSSDPIYELTERLSRASIRDFGSPQSSSPPVDENNPKVLRSKTEIPFHSIQESPNRVNSKIYNRRGHSILRIGVNFPGVPRKGPTRLLSPIRLNVDVPEKPSTTTPDPLFPNTTDEDLYGTLPTPNPSPLKGLSLD
ncbi:hypothetical protein FRC17_009405 [Serendipita sp. 399]|nr:hypothetical protein FRC17_009405 [Serendipita sp. 399]